MSKHTPGPWHAMDNQVFGPEGSRQITETDFLVFAGHIDEASRREAFANARLIAAAPELLAALERAETALCDGLLGGSTEPLGDDDSCCLLSVQYAEAVLADIRRAIKKAEGK